MKTKTKVTATPGPWSVETLPHGKSRITGEQYYDHIVQPLNVIAEHSAQKESANARLIAAAPELLEFIKECYEATTEAGLLDFVQNNAEKLIAKAEGR